ncbi:uncharacterized protein LOC110856723 [Folsomia candida]|uniref:F-box domain-containing protein n=1 Tax=Folsomia candida TaxID=158441 RepID=A0A226DLS2_FOLCA|nr:uncharacterized protein LOC110856723 [Folsomia candida]OXA45804.1 hypothetical protein Fcan01_19607 [Folsomia candida]
MEGEDAMLLEQNCRYYPSCRKSMWDSSSCGCATAESDTETEWRQHSILPYIENQKYTFGSMYTSREEQGEFIFVQTKKNPGNLAEITCSSGNYWITPGGKRVVLINDDQLKKNCRTKLNYGDKIALLGKVRPRRGLHPTIKHESLNGFFLFKECRRAMERQEGEEPSMPDDEEKVTFTPGQNYLVLSHIFSYLPFKTLKIARLVCSQWDEEATRILKKKSTVVLDFDCRHNYQHPMGSMRLLRYVKEMKNLHPNSLYLRLPPFPPAHRNLEGGKLAVKLVDDLNWFLQLDRSRHITRLNLGGPIFSGFDYKIHLAILKKLQATLCELELAWYFDFWDESSDDFAFLTEDLHLNKLEVFIFSIHADRVPAKVLLAIMSSWATAIQGIKTLKLNCHSNDERNLINCLLKYDKPLPKLEAFIGQSTRQIVLDLLLKLTNPLKTLKLNRLVCLERRENFASLENLIQKHARTLEEFEFIYDVDQQNLEALHLPIFPRLRTLSVGWWKLSDLKICFPSAHDNDDVLDYERHLPRLDALSLSMFPSIHPITASWADQRSKLEIFFPTRDRNGEPIETRCVTLRKLDSRVSLPFARRAWSQIEFPADLPISDMFPNVWNDWMTRRRTEESSPPSTKESLPVAI